MRVRLPVGYPGEPREAPAEDRSDGARPGRAHRLPLRRVRAAVGAVGRALPVVPGLGDAGADRRAPSRPRKVAAGAPSSPARRIAEVELDTARARPTGVAELDRVLGGGLVPGAVVLLAGEPGVGKSTLLLEVAAKAATTGTVLYVTGEESAGQVRLRAERTGAVHDELYLAAESDLCAIVAHIDARGAASCSSSTPCRPCRPTTPTARRAGSPRSAR